MLMYETVWKPEQAAVCLEADSKIMNEGLTGKELSEKPESIERLAEFLLSLTQKDTLVFFCLCDSPDAGLSRGRGRINGRACIDRGAAGGQAVIVIHK